MIVKPEITQFGDLFISTTAHPMGCRESVRRQIDYVKGKKVNYPPKKVLIIGASTGYGLSTRICSAFGCSASTIGIFFEKPSQRGKTATPGWYNTVAFEDYAKAAGLYTKSINGDAFSREIKEQALSLIKNDWDGKVDLVVYSLAAPRRMDPTTGKQHQSSLKPVGKTVTANYVDILRHSLSQKEIMPATDEEVQETVKVMGGEDWELWIRALLDANMLHKDSITVAYSYLGGEISYDIYREGTIGHAKKHLEETALRINTLLEEKNAGRAFTVLNKAVVTLASSAIPGILQSLKVCFRYMRELGTHEDTIHQIWRLFANRLFLFKDKVYVDNENRIRLDEWELQSTVQHIVGKTIRESKPGDLSTDEEYKQLYKEFLTLYGFELDNVDYNADVEIDVPIPSISTSTTP